MAALAACNDTGTQPQQQVDSGPPPNLSVTTSCKATEIYQIVTWLTPLRNAPLDLRGTTTIILTFSTYKQTLAQQLVMQFAAAMTPTVIAKLTAPPNPPYATKQAAVSVLIADLMQCVGLQVTQAPPPAAYLPTGGLKVIDQTGGQFTTNDAQAGVHAPAGAVSGSHLFYIVDLSDPAASTVPSGLTAAATVTRCLPERANVTEVGRCYDFSVVPDVGAQADGQGFGGNGVYAAVCSPGGHAEEVHDHLELAKVDHNSNPPTFTIYPRSEDNLTGSMSCDLGAGSPPPSASLIGGAWSKVVGALKVLASPFAPRVANASDGVGSLFRDMTHASLVYRTRPLNVSPASATVTVGQSQGFTAAPADGQPARDGPYVWSVNGVDVGTEGFPSTYGTLSVSDERAATFTAPAAVPALATFNVCVRRQAAPADRGCSAITVQGNFVGVWNGLLTTSNQPVTVIVDQQSAGTVSGDYRVAFSGGSVSYNNEHAFTGTYAGATMSFTLTPFVSVDHATVTLTLSGNNLTGTHVDYYGEGGSATFNASLSRGTVPTVELPGVITSTQGLQSLRSLQRSLDVLPSNTVTRIAGYP
jgi:hypothetical protein